MDTVVQIEVRRVYGVPAIYPVNDTAKIFAMIAGTKTLTKAVVNDIKLLGFTIEQVSTQKWEDI